MPEQTPKFEIKGPEGLFVITVGNLIDNTIEITTNFKRENQRFFFHELFLHPYIVPVGTLKDEFTTVVTVKLNFDFEIFHEDLQTLMEVCLYENTKTMAPTVAPEI